LRRRGRRQPRTSCRSLLPFCRVPARDQVAGRPPAGHSRTRRHANPASRRQPYRHFLTEPRGDRPADATRLAGQRPRTGERDSACAAVLRRQHDRGEPHRVRPPGDDNVSAYGASEESRRPDTHARGCRLHHRPRSSTPPI